MLREFQFERQGERSEADVTAVDVQHRRVPDVGTDDAVHARDVGLPKAFDRATSINQHAELIMKQSSGNEK